MVFLHEIIPGAADRSYGIQVAKLAGLPAAVVERAKSVLSQLEEKDRRSPAETLIDEKRAFLQDMQARNVQLFFTHDAGCAMAQVVCDDKGRFAAAHEKAQLLGWELDD